MTINSFSLATDILSRMVDPQIRTAFQGRYDFNVAKAIMHKIVDPDDRTAFEGRFIGDYNGQGVVTTALKILHKAAREGTCAQQKELAEVRQEIVTLNALLSNKQIAQRARASLGLEVGSQAHELGKISIALPQTTGEKMIEMATLIPRIVFSILVDIALLPLAGLLLLYMHTGPRFDPVLLKTDATPILLVHGSGFNESEWIWGRQFLKKPEYGSVFSLNYDELASNDPKKGIDDYAADKVRKKILEIKRVTGQDRIILIGHSMGGMIAGRYAEHFADQDHVIVDHVLSIASPWRGSPVVDRFMSGPDAPKRYSHMSTLNPFRQQLVAQALASERAGKRKYYCIGSQTDYLVPGSTSTLTEDPSRQRVFGYMGHYGVIAFPCVWYQMRSWLDDIYAAERVTASQNVLSRQSSAVPRAIVV